MQMAEHSPLTGWHQSAIRSAFWQVPASLLIAVYPREVVIEALARNAAAVILCHNHPSGSTTPSRADEALTATLKQTLALVDVRVLDHLIVTPGEVFSFAAHGLM
jgi:DNA repair protein RadC